MKLKKYILIGMTALLAVVACDNKKNSKDKEKVKAVNVKKDISNEEIKKYSEYLKISEEPNSEEWNDFIKEITDVMQKSPKMEAIDTNAQNLVDSLIQEQKVLTEINDYFEKGDYKTDKLGRVDELNDKYRVVLRNRLENSKIFSNSLHEFAEAINKKMEAQLQKDGKTATLNILKFVNSANGFEEAAFSKNNLNFDEEEVKGLEKANNELQKAYKNIAGMTVENAKKENISESDFKKIKESSKALSENTQKMLTGVKNQNIQDVVISASNILSAKTDLENVFNVLLIQK